MSSSKQELEDHLKEAKASVDLKDFMNNSNKEEEGEILLGMYLRNLRSFSLVQEAEAEEEQLSNQAKEKMLW